MNEVIKWLKTYLIEEVFHEPEGASLLGRIWPCVLECLHTPHQLLEVLLPPSLQQQAQRHPVLLVPTLAPPRGGPRRGGGGAVPGGGGGSPQGVALVLPETTIHQLWRRGQEFCHSEPLRDKYVALIRASPQIAQVNSLIPSLIVGLVTGEK